MNELVTAEGTGPAAEASLDEREPPVEALAGVPSRVPKLRPSDLTDEQRTLYDAIAGGRRAAGPQLFRLVDEELRLEGPFNAFLLQPRLGVVLQALGSAVRYETTLTDRAREIAILVVAVHWHSDFEWYAHAALGRHVGLTNDELQSLRDGHYDDLPPTDSAVARTASELTSTGNLSDAGYQAAVDAFGTGQLFELTTLVGYYATLALQLKVFRVAAPDARAR